MLIFKLRSTHMAKKSRQYQWIKEKGLEPINLVVEKHEKDQVREQAKKRNMTIKEYVLWKLFGAA